MRRFAQVCALVLVTGPALTLAACGSSSAAAGDHDVAITVTANGFEPKALTAKVGKPVTLVVTRKVEHTCATEIVIKDFGIEQPLPLDQPVRVTFTPTRPGKVRFACGMDMIAGEIAVQ